jgi:transketolase
VIHGESREPEVILIATGSEVALCVNAAKELEAEGISVRVVSMPCMELFERQSAEYKESVLPDCCRKRVSVEALSSFGWGKYTGLDGRNISVDNFGASAPAGQLFERFGFTVAHVKDTVREMLAK